LSARPRIRQWPVTPESRPLRWCPLPLASYDGQGTTTANVVPTCLGSPAACNTCRTRRCHCLYILRPRPILCHAPQLPFIRHRPCHLWTFCLLVVSQVLCLYLPRIPSCAELILLTCHKTHLTLHFCPIDNLLSKHVVRESLAYFPHPLRPGGKLAPTVNPAAQLRTPRAGSTQLQLEQRKQ